MEKQWTGIVVEGNRLGRQIGFPTANMACGDTAGIAPGVYAVRAVIDGRVYDGMANFGPKPTVGGNDRDLLEVHFFGFDGDIYGRTLTVEVVGFIREIRRFDSLEQLKEQIKQDRLDSLTLLAKEKQL